MTIHELVESYLHKGINTRAWVDQEGFDGLYVRVGKRYINKTYVDVIDLANISATSSGKGTFKALVRYLTEKYPEFTIHVESVLTERFKYGLLKLGFLRTHNLDSFYLPKDNNDNQNNSCVSSR